jgi:hypothetical protein
LEQDTEVEWLLDHFHISVADTPVVICRGQTVLRNPTNREIAECLGFNEAVDESRMRDLVILGAGPAGIPRAKLLCFWLSRRSTFTCSSEVLPLPTRCRNTLSAALNRHPTSPS